MKDNNLEFLKTYEPEMITSFWYGYSRKICYRYATYY